MRVPELPEGSGLAASRKTPGRFWSHNDSGDAVLFALDGNGRVTGRLTLPGTKLEDWEAVAVGSCPSGSCIYLADIGDNNARRRRIAIYRVAEPAEASGTVQVSDVFYATYPDHAHDAETLLVSDSGRLHIVTKGDTGPVSLYRFPSELQLGTTMRLERVGGPRVPANHDWITDGAVSPDGHGPCSDRPAVDILSNGRPAVRNWREAGQVALAKLGEPQGEGVTFGSDNSLYLMSEGGGRRQPGRFARLTCTLSP